jgi:hypothetical protein
VCGLALEQGDDDMLNTFSALNSARRMWFFLSLVAMMSVTGRDAVAQENVSELKRRISELETENRKLREKLEQIIEIVGDMPAVRHAGQNTAQGFRLFVEPGDWGSSSLADTKKVCESVTDVFVPHLAARAYAPFLIQNDVSGPITLYRRGENGEYIIRVNTRDRAWAQLAFQFAHELCHVLCNYRDAHNPQLWFEETLCECASLFALRRMAQIWKTKPPYPNWKPYSSALADYAAERLAVHNTELESAQEIFERNRDKLEESGTNREINNRLAAKLLPLFEAEPDGWESLQYLNKGQPDENLDFEVYLRRWHRRAPDSQKKFVEKVAGVFGFNLKI